MDRMKQSLAPKEIIFGKHKLIEELHRNETDALAGKNTQMYYIHF